MPTGYTYPVAEGEVTEFKDFALSCARAFGALISMRDDASDAPIPDEIAPQTDYYDQRLADNKKRLGEIQAMTNTEADAAANADHVAALASRTNYLAGKDTEAQRLNSMLAKVREWIPPSPDHAPMKEFMVEQLTISLPGEYAPSIPALLDGATWRKKEIDRLADEIVRNQKSIDDEVERARGRTEWLKQLRGSLGA